MCSVVTPLTLGALNDEAEEAEMTFVGEVNGFPHFLPPHCKLLCELLCKCSWEFMLSSTLVFAIAEEIKDEGDKLLA